MGKGGKEKLNQALNEHLNTIHDTFQIFDQTPPSTAEKVSWKEVVQMGEQVSKQATLVGMLYAGDAPGVQALEENMLSYFNILQGFLLHSHGSLIGAGPTLSSSIHASIKRVVDCSFKLLQAAVSSYGSTNSAKKSTIPQLAGAVWDSCSALKKTPSTNVTAIGRAMTQVAVSIKDVIREMKELKPADDSSEILPVNRGDSINGDDYDESLGIDLSQEEMKIAQSTTSIVSEVLLVVKELIRSITGLLKQEASASGKLSIDSLEKLLKQSKDVGLEVDEIGACLYPPQEISSIVSAFRKICSLVDVMESELEKLAGLTEDFSIACTGFRDLSRRLETEFECVVSAEVASEMEKLVVCD